MLTGRLPGLRAANTACIKLANALIGAQFVSPSTRMPTSIRGIESRIDTALSQNGKPRDSFCTINRAAAEATVPQIIHRSGNSFPLTSLADKVVNVRAITFHLRINAVMPPTTITPVAGHITHFSTAAKLWIGTHPRETSAEGAMIQASTIPSPIERVIRKPTRRPAPNERTPSSEPRRSAAPLAPNAISPGINRQGPSRTIAINAEIPPDPKSARSRSIAWRRQIKNDQGLTGRGSVSESEILLIDVVSPERNRQEGPEKRGEAHPEKNLSRGQVERKSKRGARVEHVDRGQDDAHEADFAGGGAGRLRHVRFEHRGRHPSHRGDQCQGDEAEKFGLDSVGRRGHFASS